MEKKSYSLQMFGLPVLGSMEDIADSVHLSSALIYRFSRRNNSYYRTFDVAKKSGGVRRIACPSRKMKATQAWILRNILDKLRVTHAATGFRRSMSIRDNAERHKDNRFFLMMDIEEFFPSIEAGKVYSIFRTIGYNHFAAQTLTSICTFENRLPQGGVCSPALSNIVCIRLDNRIMGYVGKRNITYTRYADDLVFSSNNPANLVRSRAFVERILREEGFRPNKRKTRFAGPRRRRSVTGLVVSDESVGIGTEQKRLLRAKIFRLFANDWTSRIGDFEKLRSHIRGWLSFVNSVDGSSHTYFTKYISKLSDRFNNHSMALLPQN